MGLSDPSYPTPGKISTLFTMLILPALSLLEGQVVVDKQVVNDLGVEARYETIQKQIIFSMEAIGDFFIVEDKNGTVAADEGMVTFPLFSPEIEVSLSI